MKLFRKNKDVKSQIKKTAEIQLSTYGAIENKFIPSPRKKIFTNIETLLVSAEKHDKDGDIVMRNFFLNAIVERINVEPK